MSDLSTPAGACRRAIERLKHEEFDRFRALQAQFIEQVRDDTLRAELQAALLRLAARQGDPA